jgi:hypothetical protein
MATRASHTSGLRPARRVGVALLVAACCAAAAPASAKVYAEWTPRVSLLAGGDDNVPMNGTGGDFFGRAQPGLRLDLYGEHQMRVDLDCQASIARLAHPDRFQLDSGDFATGEQCRGWYRQRVSPRTSLHFDSKVAYVQDPFAISGLGLLLRVGQTQVFNAHLLAEATHAVSPHSSWTFAVDSNSLAFGANDPGNGAVVAPSVTYGWYTSARNRWELTGREQLFFGFGASPSPLAPTGAPGGLLTEAHAALAGFVRRLTEISTLTTRVGGIYVTGINQGAWQPVGRFEYEIAAPTAAFRLVAGHDLIIGASRAGALVGDIAEASVMGKLAAFEGHVRAGMYRNAGVGNWGLGALGYSTEASLDYRFAKEWTMGAAALRDARITGLDGPDVDRDVVELRLTWERARN